MAGAELIFGETELGRPYWLGGPYAVDLLPGLLLFSLGLAITVAPLSAAVLADADEHNAGIASATNNAVARVAGLVAIAGLGAVIAASYSSALDRELGERLGGASLSPAAVAVVEQARAATLTTADVGSLDGEEARQVRSASISASAHAFHEGMGIAAALVALGGLIGIAGIRNPRRIVKAEDCSGGQLVGAPRDAAGCSDAGVGPGPDGTPALAGSGHAGA